MPEDLVAQAGGGATITPQTTAVDGESGKADSLPARSTTGPLADLRLPTRQPPHGWASLAERFGYDFNRRETE